MNDPTNADEDFTADLVTEAETQDFVLLEDSASRSEGSIVLRKTTQQLYLLKELRVQNLKTLRKKYCIFKPSRKSYKNTFNNC